MKPDMTRDPARDPLLAEVLRSVEPPPESEPDWDTLRARIMDRAALPLARLRRQVRWWEHAARWAQPAIPAAMAAGIALAAFLGGTLSPGAGDAEAMGMAASMPSVDAVLHAPFTAVELDALAGEGADTDAFLRLAVGYTD